MISGPFVVAAERTPILLSGKPAILSCVRVDETRGSSHVHPEYLALREAQALAIIARSNLGGLDPCDLRAALPHDLKIMKGKRLWG